MLNQFESSLEGRIFAAEFSLGQIAENPYLVEALALVEERVTRQMIQEEGLQYLRNANCKMSFGDSFGRNGSAQFTISRLITALYLKNYCKIPAELSAATL